MLAKGLGYTPGLIAMIALDGGVGFIGAPILAAIAVTFIVLLVATVAAAIIDETYSATDAIADVLCGLVLALSVAAALNTYMKAITGVLKTIVDIVGTATGVLGVSKLSPCSPF